MLVTVATVIALLLPALSRTRETGRRAVCAANLRSLGTALAHYANDFQDAALLGYCYGWRQYSYLARQNTFPSTKWLGVLVEHGSIDAPAACFCPSERDELLRFNTATNPWLADAPTGTSTRLGFAVRPVVDWPLPLGTPMPGGLPRLSDFAPFAVSADLFHKATTLDTRHREGLNRGRGDGSVAWIPRRTLEAVDVNGLRWAGITGDFAPTWNDLFLLPGRTPADDRGLWAALGPG